MVCEHDVGLTFYTGVRFKTLVERALSSVSGEIRGVDFSTHGLKSYLQRQNS
jgi:hypothetical protein